MISVKFKLLIFVIVILIIPGLNFCTNPTVREKELLDQQVYLENAFLEEKIKTNQNMTDFIAKVGMEPISKYNYNTLDEYSIFLQSNNDDILSVIFYDEEGNILNPGHRKKQEIMVPEKFWDTKEKEILSTNNEELIGKVEVIFSLESIYNIIEN